MLGASEPTNGPQGGRRLAHLTCSGHKHHPEILFNFFREKCNEIICHHHTKFEFLSNQNATLSNIAGSDRTPSAPQVERVFGSERCDELTLWKFSTFRRCRDRSHQQRTIAQVQLGWRDWQVATPSVICRDLAKLLAFCPSHALFHFPTFTAVGKSPVPQPTPNARIAKSQSDNSSTCSIHISAEK